MTLGHFHLAVNDFSGDFGAGSYGSAPIAAIIAPLFLGLIADRFFALGKSDGHLYFSA